jgi:RHS repeat-associated protein
MAVCAPALVPGGLPQAAANLASGAFALGGGVGGQVDPRTGQFSVSVPLAVVTGRGDSGVSFALSWDQSRAGGSVDRFGWGAGWGLGTTFVDPTDGGRVYPANGGVYAFDASFASGLGNYLQEDLVFTPVTGTLPARPGVPAATYNYTISYDNGKIDHFDADGNLISRRDRFGNRTDLTYQQISDDQWVPTTVTDSYGLVTTFIAGDGIVTVSSPQRSDGVVSRTVVNFGNQNEVRSVTDPAGRTATFDYTSVPGTANQYLDTVTSPAGARTTVTYDQVAYPNAAPLLIARAVDVDDAGGQPLQPTSTFDMDPPENTNRHNYAGYPDYVSTTEDALFASGDKDYRYTTQISNGQLVTMSTYDAGHRLVAREIRVTGDTGQVAVQQQEMSYPDLAPPQSLPANFARPHTSAVTHLATSTAAGVRDAGPNERTVLAATTYDDHGRVVSTVDEAGTTVTNTYDDTYGLVTSIKATGKDGTVRVVTNQLSADKRVVMSSTKAETTAASALSARSVVRYQYDDVGQLTSRTVAWADGVAPPGNGGGPGSSTTTYTRTVDVAARTQTTAATIGAGTPAATTVTTVVDLVTGSPVRVIDGLGRATTTTYDAAGRELTVTPPTGLTTLTRYQAAGDGMPASRTVTGPDGHQVRTTFDALGRTIAVTDNVRNGVFTADPATRVLTRNTYSTDGLSVTSTDRTGRSATTVHDPRGRPVQSIGLTGITTSTAYDDVANRVTTRTIGDGASGPAQITTSTFDDLDREVSSRTTYPVGGGPRPQFLADPVSQTAYDGIGRKTAITANDVRAEPDYAGPGGVSAATTLTPTGPSAGPADVVTAQTTSMLDGSASSRTLQQPGSPGRSGLTLRYDAVGRVVSSTDQLGQTTSFTYLPDGRPATQTSPSGTVTTNTYDARTGQLTKVTVAPANGTPLTTTYTYVPPGQPGAGLVASVSDGRDIIRYGYDADRNRTSVTYPDGATVSADYADNGQLLTTTDVTGAVTTYVYDADSRLRSATQARGGATLASVRYTYDSLDRLATITRGNGLVTTNTYTPNSLLATQTTVAANGVQVESHRYGYNSHGLLARKTDISAAPSRCTVVCTPSPSTFGTWTTTYTYDAYDRLVGSAVSRGGAPAGPATTTIAYTLDVSGNVLSTRRVTRASGARPTTTTQVTNDQYDAAGQLTQRTVGSAAPQEQRFDTDGRVIAALNGATTAYRPDGLPQTVTMGAATTTFRYWPDGTRRQSSTVDPAAGTTTIDYHYGVDGTLTNDTTTQPGAPSPDEATASYLLTTGREARTLLPAAAGGPTATADPVTTGAGVGYYLRDRHSSVTAMVDSSGAVTNTYAYADYGGSALLDGRVGRLSGSGAGTSPGQANPFQYTGASVRGLYTDAALGTLATPVRFYDPNQGRFTARDLANVHNRYAAFGSDPINKVDPSGTSPVSDAIIDALFVVVLVVSAVATGGTAVALVGAVEAGAELAGWAAAEVGFQIASTATSIGGVGVSATQLVDAIATTMTGKHLLSADEQDTLDKLGVLLGAAAGAAGMAAAGSALFKEGAEVAVEATTALDKAAPTLSGSDQADAVLATKDPATRGATSIDGADDDILLPSTESDSDDLLSKPTNTASTKAPSTTATSATTDTGSTSPTNQALAGHTPDPVGTPTAPSTAATAASSPPPTGQPAGDAAPPPPSSNVLAPGAVTLTGSVEKAVASEPGTRISTQTAVQTVVDTGRSVPDVLPQVQGVLPPALPVLTEEEATGNMIFDLFNPN